MSTFSEIHKKHVNTLVGENVDSLDFELDGIYSYHGSLTGYNMIPPRPVLYLRFTSWKFTCEPSCRKACYVFCHPFQHKPARPPRLYGICECPVILILKRVELKSP